MKTAPKFKGKRLDNGEWVEGSLITILNTDLDASIKQVDVFPHNAKASVPVDPATVEQIGGDLVNENKRLRELLKCAKCHNCDGTGVYYTKTGVLDGACEEVVPEPCQWFDEVKEALKEQ